MTTARWFHLFRYLTLAFSCAALAFAEGFYLPFVPVCLAPVLVLLLLAWWLEGRWCLPTRGANFLGLLIFAGAASWLTMQVLDEKSLLARVPWHLALVPYMGPLLMAALLVKLFRPRRASDFWQLQGLGLMQVGLGCALAGGVGFGALLAAYFACAITCLALHYRMVDGGWRMIDAKAAIRYPLSTIHHPPSTIHQESGWRLLRFAARWSLLAAAPALLLFLLTPRGTTSAWDVLSGFQWREKPLSNLPANYYSDGINLNGTGVVELDDEIVFRVIATQADGRVKRDLPADQRWRGSVLDWYDNGNWTVIRHLPSRSWPRTIQNELPDFGPGQYFLNFETRPHQAGSLVLAEPIRLGSPSAPLPVIRSSEGRRHFVPFFAARDTVLPRRSSVRREYHYRQVVPGSADAMRAPAESVNELAYMERTTRLAPELRGRLQEWTVKLLRRLSEWESRFPLPDAVRLALAQPQHSLRIEAAQWEAVARVLCDYLARSGDFTYTLNLTRADATIDPVLDFLFNLRCGHCERYATALALMCRSIGIPSRVIKGFHGWDKLGDGIYVVRHHHAHAWVEVLTPRRDGQARQFDWLTLDPTPAQTQNSDNGFALMAWCVEAWDRVTQLWQTLIVDYNAEQQAGLLDNFRLNNLLSAPGEIVPLLSIVVVVPLAFVSLRRLRRRRRAVPVVEGAALHNRLLLLFRRHTSLRPACGQTPREFGDSARRYLQAYPALAALANVPVRVVEMFYRVRFGGWLLNEAESHCLNAELEQLGRAFRLHHK